MFKPFRSSVGALAATVAWGLWVGGGGAYAKKKDHQIDTNDPTYQLYHLLDSTYGGKLTNFYLVADTYTDPKTPNQKFQHVLSVEYDKNLFFGRFKIQVRSVAQLTPDQLKTYTTKQIYDFGSDSEKFEKINPGPFGQEGDAYFRVVDDEPMTTAPITDDVRKEYETFLTAYILPALQKKGPG